MTTNPPEDREHAALEACGIHSAGACCEYDRLLREIFKDKAVVEQALFDAANGKAQMPDQQKLRELALLLGHAGPLLIAHAAVDTWRCFHCDEVFTDRGAAADHFGTSEMQRPACQIDIKHVRWLEDEHRKACEEDSEVLRTISGLASEHEKLRRQAEEIGYARGLVDAKKHPEELGLRLAAVPEIDYKSLIRYGWAAHKYRQGTKECVAMARGAVWMRDQLSKETP